MRSRNKNHKVLRIPFYFRPAFRGRALFGVLFKKNKYKLKHPETWRRHRRKLISFPVISAWPAMISFMTETILFCCLVAAEKRMRYRMSVIYGHPVIAATRALRFSDHVTKRNGSSGGENENVQAKKVHWANLVRIMSVSYAKRDSTIFICLEKKSGNRSVEGSSERSICTRCNLRWVRIPMSL